MSGWTIVAIMAGSVLGVLLLLWLDDWCERRWGHLFRDLPRLDDEEEVPRRGW